MRDTVDCLVLIDCDSLTTPIDMKTIKRLHVSHCGHDITGPLTNSGNTLSFVNVTGDVSILHLLSTCPVTRLGLMQCTQEFMYQTLHSANARLRLHLVHLTLWWALYQPQPCFKQLHLNQFPLLSTLVLKNYRPDAICTRNLNKSIRVVNVYTRDTFTLHSLIVRMLKGIGARIDIFNESTLVTSDHTAPHYTL